MRVTVKIRHQHQPAPAMIEAVGADEVRVTFDEPQRAITPGQAAVFYDGDVVVGGGWIEDERRSQAADHRTVPATMSE